MEEENILTVRKIKKYYPIKGGILKKHIGDVKAVESVSFEMKVGESLGVVGESGCGKSTLGRTVLGLEDITEGQVFFKGKEIQHLSKRLKQPFIKEMQMIFQDPYASLNPRQRVGDALVEVFSIHTSMSKLEKEKAVIELLKEVGLKEEHFYNYPHQFSGGQRQRVGIARALALNPSLVVADEAVSALDVSVQAKVLKLLKRLQEKYNLSYLFISHDLGVVRYFCDRVLVMYLGNVVEIATVEQLFTRPQHPYTQALISAIPRPRVDRNRKRIQLEGDLPNPANPPTGCPFHTRCPIAQSVCKSEKPELIEREERHLSACHFSGQLII